MPLLALSCSNTHTKQVLIFIFAVFNKITSFLTVVISYLYILSAILRIHSAKGRCKVFSTCTSHLMAITIFYGTLSFMYLQPSSSHSLNTDKVASVFYSCDPHAEPPIYSLRNKEVKDAFVEIDG
ncbi:unnamed protein product [Lepidochelys olivacea]